ncbi:LysE family transporter [Flavobacterium sp. SE-1-e]|uniref:LysE family transporter n=2 Tax=Flavobacterium agrisoli TaxID=2793066 RepID=A0A934PP17_9FLAO|nr:LysE family transporter [Flavobacterium agrisoli]
MRFFFLLLTGFITAFPGIMLPGLINMTAAKINLKEGSKNAISFVFGALLVITFQISIAIFFARVINARPEVVVLLREIGFGVFTALTIYFLFIAKKPKFKKTKIKKKSKKNRFFFGMLLAALNLFPIPFFVFATIALASYNLLSFEINSLFVFILGAILGTFTGLYLYMVFMKKMETKTDKLSKNMNLIIGTITAVVAFITLMNIVDYYWS